MNTERLGLETQSTFTPDLLPEGIYFYRPAGKQVPSSMTCILYTKLLAGASAGPCRPELWCVRQGEGQVQLYTKLP